MPSDDPLAALGSLAPPARFSEARFDSYRAASRSQRDALRATRAFTERVEKPPSLPSSSAAPTGGAAPSTAGIAEKFDRTVSRLRELCAIKRVAVEGQAAAVRSE